MKPINIIYTNKTADRMEYKRCIDMARKDFCARSHKAARWYAVEIAGNEDNTVLYTTRKFMERASHKGTDEYEALIDLMADFPGVPLVVC